MRAIPKAWAVAAGAAALAAVIGGCAQEQAKPAAQPAPATVTAPAPHVTVTQAPPQTVTASPPQAAPAPPAAAVGPDPATVVREFYADLNSGDYQAAWALGGNNIAGTDYATWVSGYATTDSVSGQATDAGGGVVDVTFTAYQSDGSATTYSGTYTVSGGVIVSADVTQTG
jgi:hypothetical protein